MASAIHHDSPQSTWQLQKPKCHFALNHAYVLQTLANVTTDAETARLAKEDADYFFSKHNLEHGSQEEYS